MNVSLTPQLEKMIQNRVKSGRYNSASEVIRESLRLLEEREVLREANLEQLRRDINEGVRQADAGKVLDLDIAALKEKARERKRIRG